MAALGPQTAHIFRITHAANVPWILRHGLHCQTSNIIDPNFVPIGMPDLIDRRATHPVLLGPGGTLGDYVPFYFTPWSIMLLNIKTGFNNVIQRPNSEIVILVSSLPRLREIGASFIFTNGHAYMQETDYFDDISDLDRIDWDLLRRRDFKRDPDDPGKLGRYQAEALVYQCVPVDALLGIVCYDLQVKAAIEREVQGRNLPISVKARPDWYF